jgi:hypothetical protein
VRSTHHHQRRKNNDNTEREIPLRSAQGFLNRRRVIVTFKTRPTSTSHRISQCQVEHETAQPTSTLDKEPKMSNTQVGNVYQQIIADVVESSRVDFEEGGVDEHVLEELRSVWRSFAFHHPVSISISEFILLLCIIHLPFPFCFHVELFWWVVVSWALICIFVFDCCLWAGPEFSTGGRASVFGSCFIPGCFRLRDFRQDARTFWV